MGKKGKTILILGNGFDLAHGLPTKYADFLNFCIGLEALYIRRTDGTSGANTNRYKDFLISKKLNQVLIDSLMEAYKNAKCEVVTQENGNKGYNVASDNQYVEEIHRCLVTNVWYKYFVDLIFKHNIRGINWIDFESEIRFIIQLIDKNANNLLLSWKECTEKFSLEIPNEKEKFDGFKGCFCTLIKFEKWHDKDRAILIKDFRKKCYEDLEKFIRALEIYLSHFVKKIPICKKVKEIADIKPDYVISFNYTDTYERVYGFQNVFHIHGKSVCDRHINENNMVLGIDEYWGKDDRDEHTNFTIFKKFAQRIQKKTGIDNYIYMKEIREIYKAEGKCWTGNVDTSTVHSDGTSLVYVFGHSLDVTDKDILSDFFTDIATAVTVYCKDKETQGELIANVIQLMTEASLLEKVNCLPPKLQFVLQEDED